MAFKDQLRKKIAINEMAERIRASIGPPDSDRRIDKDLMRRFLAEGPYEKIIARDLELYRLSPEGDPPRFLVLDNDLPVYQTHLQDVVLRKSPLVKEMLSVRNVIKILNDAQVVVSRKEDSLEALRTERVAALDLRFTPEDIDDLVLDGRSALENRYADGVADTLRLLAELLGYREAPAVLQAPHRVVWGAPAGTAGQGQFGPLVIYDPMRNALKRIAKPVGLKDPQAVAHYEAVAAHKRSPDEEGGEVFQTLGRILREGHRPAAER